MLALNITIFTLLVYFVDTISQIQIANLYGFQIYVLY